MKKIKLIINKLNKNYLIISIFITGFILRIWGIGFGLPDFHFHTDEDFIISNLFQMHQNKSIIPENIVYPSLIYYCLYPFLILLKILPEPVVRETILLIGRIFSATLGTLSILILYLIIKTVYSKTIAIVSSLFFSFNFSHVVSSHYLKVDIPGTFLGLITLLFSILILKKNKLIYYCLSGCFLALAFMMQYTQIFYIVPFLSAHIISSTTKVDNRSVIYFFNKKLLVFIIFFLMISFLINPSFYLAFNNFLSIKSLFAQAIEKSVTLTSNNNLNTPIWYILYLITTGLFYPVFVLAVGGILILAKDLHNWKNHIRGKALITFLSFITIYCIFIFINEYRMDRLIIPLIPFFALFCAIFINKFWGIINALNCKNFLKKIIIIGIIIVFIITPLIRTTIFSYAISQKDTREEAGKWLVNNYNKNTLIFATGGTIFIGQYLQKKGYPNIMNLFPLDTKEIFLYPGEILLIDSSTYYTAQNYQRINKYRLEWESYQLLQKKGKFIKNFTNPLFKSSYFSPPWLIPSSTVVVYHNPTIEVIVIPEIPKLANEKINFEYLPKDMITNMNFKYLKGEKVATTNGRSNAIITGPSKLFPKGKYTVNYQMIIENCQNQNALVVIGVQKAGTEIFFDRKKIYCLDKNNDNSYTLSFTLDNPEKFDLTLSGEIGTAFSIKKIVVNRI